MSRKVCNFAPANLTQGQLLSKKGSGFSAVGSAHVWGARGRWFESSNPDEKKKLKINRLQLLSLFLKVTQYRCK